MTEVSEAFLRLAVNLRALPNVASVGTPSSMRLMDKIGNNRYRFGAGNGFCAEWYAEAEFLDGRGLTLDLVLAWDTDEWSVDSSVRSHSNEGEYVLLELPTRNAITSAEVAVDLIGQAKLLMDREAEAVRLFLERGAG